MIITEDFYTALTERGFDFFCGVPDSLLKELCACIADKCQNNIITANEGNAVALAAGYYLATQKPGLVYMQNSGVGNAVNPLLSLVDEDVYRMPMLFVIGWRGEPGVKDEPQHIKQGKLTLPLLDCVGLDYTVLDADSDVEAVLAKALAVLQDEKPYAIVVRKGSFSPYKGETKAPIISDFNKEEALAVLLASLPSEALFVSTTGKLSRELFELRETCGESHARDFLTVGSMGHTSQIALGAAIGAPDKTVYCLDGDGSFLMHMGSAAVNASLNVKNMKHIVFNNAAHDSVGGQPTVGNQVDFSAVAKACGYTSAVRVSDAESLKTAAAKLHNGSLDFLEILVSRGARADLGRPTISPVDCKKNFMECL